MYLKSLTLRGFKSFASATTLNFEPGITCVVGPNGSGKSNVVDALSWVMGEQGAKTLRGGKMEDVIFAGTSGRAPLGRAEVVLTIDNSDGALPIDYSEVTISRTMFRNGGSEYAINGNAARLLDIHELLSDSGIGREMHVVVGQGQLDSILQATPEIRRGFIEEAAGVLKHRKRKEKAVRKLDACEANLNRLSDLINEIRRQLKPLGPASGGGAQSCRDSGRGTRRPGRGCSPRTCCKRPKRCSPSLRRAGDAGQRRRSLEQALEGARAAEVTAEAAVRDGVPRLAAAQEAWYSLAALKERVASTLFLSRGNGCGRRRTTRVSCSFARDPDELDREAARIAAEENELSSRAAAPSPGTGGGHGSSSCACEDAHRGEENRLAGLYPGRSRPARGLSEADRSSELTAQPR